MIAWLAEWYRWAEELLQAHQRGYQWGMVRWLA